MTEGCYGYQKNCDCDNCKEYDNCILDVDGDQGIVACGKCGKHDERHKMFLSLKHLYLCENCEEDE